MTSHVNPPFHRSSMASGGTICAYCGDKHPPPFGGWPVGGFKCFAQTAWESARRAEDELAAQIADFIARQANNFQQGGAVQNYLRELGREIRAGKWRRE